MAMHLQSLLSTPAANMTEKQSYDERLATQDAAMVRLISPLMSGGDNGTRYSTDTKIYSHKNVTGA